VRFGISCAAALGAVALAASLARADGLSTSEAERLTHGETVVRPQTVEHGARRYVGGVTYTVLDDSADDLGPLLDDVNVWTRILPKTRSARRVGTAGRDVLVELTSGNSLVQATYTVRVHRDGDLVRFWVDPSRRHDIEDAWGFVRAEPMAERRTLVTYGVLVDLGPGIFRDLFEERVKAAALAVPERLRTLVRDSRAAR
jgi:hypothetical protein